MHDGAMAMQRHIGGNPAVRGLQKLQMPVNVTDRVNVHTVLSLRNSDMERSGETSPGPSDI